MCKRIFFPIQRRYSESEVWVDSNKCADIVNLGSWTKLRVGPQEKA